VLDVSDYKGATINKLVNVARNYWGNGKSFASLRFINGSCLEVQL